MSWSPPLTLSRLRAILHQRRGYSHDLLIMFVHCIFLRTALDSLYARIHGHRRNKTTRPHKDEATAIAMTVCDHEREEGGNTSTGASSLAA